MKAYKSVIKSAIASGYHVHINDGEEIVRCGDSYKAAIDAAESVEESWILVRRPVAYTPPSEFPTVARLFVILDTDDEETVADWGVDNDPEVKNWADRWSDAYYANTSFCGEVK